MNPLLAINIPTFKRPNPFIKQISILKNEIDNLPKNFQSQVMINVFENPSEFTETKISYLNKIQLNNLSYRINKINTGSDANIIQCCTYSPESLFTWVLGDDDYIIPGSIKRILNILSLNQDKLGLLLIGDGIY